jgi:hypothetical protein
MTITVLLALVTDRNPRKSIEKIDVRLMQP